MGILARAAHNRLESLQASKRVLERQAEKGGLVPEEQKRLDAIEKDIQDLVASGDPWDDSRDRI
jgi:hypothetical protein